MKRWGHGNREDGEIGVVETSPSRPRQCPHEEASVEAVEEPTTKTSTAVEDEENPTSTPLLLSPQPQTSMAAPPPPPTLLPGVPPT